MPNPHYFEVAADQTEETLVNASGNGPEKLTAYVEALGVPAGIAAMALYVRHRGRAINFPITSVVADLFEVIALALHSATTISLFRVRGRHPDPILRVALDT